MNNKANPYQFCVNRSDYARQIAEGLEAEIVKHEAEAAEKLIEARTWRAKSAEYANAADVLKNHIEKILVTPDLER